MQLQSMEVYTHTVCMHMYAWLVCTLYCCTETFMLLTARFEDK